VLVGQGEELSDVGGPDLPHGLHQPFDHRPEHLLRPQVDRSPGQPRVAAVQQAGAEQVQPVHRPRQQCPDDRLGRRIAAHVRQGVQVLLNGSSGAVGVHDQPS